MNVQIRVFCLEFHCFVAWSVNYEVVVEKYLTRLLERDVEREPFAVLTYSVCGFAVYISDFVVWLVVHACMIRSRKKSSAVERICFLFAIYRILIFRNFRLLRSLLRIFLSTAIFFVKRWLLWELLSAVIACPAFEEYARAAFVVSQVLSRLLLRRLRGLKVVCVRPVSLFFLSHVGSWLRDFGTFETIFQPLIRLSHVDFDFILPKFAKNYLLKIAEEELLKSFFFLFNLSNAPNDRYERRYCADPLILCVLESTPRD
jgi:hypothetical protein